MLRFQALLIASCIQWTLSLRFHNCQSFVFNNELFTFDFKTTKSYRIYKLEIYSPDIPKPGLTYLQLFALDPVV